MGSPVVGVNTNGIGVSGKGSQYGVFGSSTAAFAGVSGSTTSAAPALLGQSSGTGPGIVAFSGPAALVYSILDGGLDGAAVDLATQNPDCAAILAGNVVATGNVTANTATIGGTVQAANATLTETVSAATATISGKLTAATATITGDATAKNVTVSGTVKTHDATFTGNIAADSATFSGDITAKNVKLSGADCAEEFDTAAAQQLEPGTVVVFDSEAALTQCAEAYSKSVAGVISGAGDYRPGVILDRRPSSQGRAVLALMGKVFCKVDAAYAPIEVGDMLTTSPTHGYAMKATDQQRSFGAVIGKALSSHKNGCGLIPILVGLR